VQLKVMMMMTMISSTIDCPSIIATQPPIVPNTSTASVTQVLMEDADDPHASCQRTSASTISNHVASNNRKELQCQGYHRRRLPAPS
jgi:hypothetical protein